MPTQKYLIAPFNSGLVKDVKPWQIPEEAFEVLQNVYVWRGRVRKRIGTSLLYGAVLDAQPQLVSRVRANVGTIMGGAAAGVVPGNVFAVGQMFSILDQMFTVQALGLPVIMLNSTGVGVGTYNTTTGAFTFAGIAAPDTTPIYFYPATSIMGFAQFESSVINQEICFAFDTQFAYYYTGNGWDRLTGGPDVWVSNNVTDNHFISWTMYNGSSPGLDVMFVVNNSSTGSVPAGDGIRYYDGIQWNQLTNSYSADPDTAILGARFVIQFKNRLILLNTYEEDGTPGSNDNYPNRARWCQIGDPTSATAWYEPPGMYGKGDFLDAPTQQQIISAQIYKDRLIVYFERSTWELVYTGNQVLPFIWQNINIELGVESTFSRVAFDEGIVGIGQTGIHVCNGTNVQRIDQKIPNDIYDIQNANSGIDRVYGVRDYIAELAYWAIPNIVNMTHPVIYPNQLLVYNYRNNSWSYWNDTITAFGYIEMPVAAAFNQSFVRLVIGGNQEGYTFYMNQDEPTNAGVIQITNMVVGGAGLITITAMRHNLQGTEYIYIDYVNGSGTLPNVNDKIYQVTYVDANTITITDASVLGGAYSGGGTFATVSAIQFLTKDFNFFLADGNNTGVKKIDAMVDKTTSSEITIQILPSTGTETQELILTTAPYSATYYPLEQSQQQLWHTVYPQSTGCFLQFGFGWNHDQMTNYDNEPGINISRDDFQLHALLLHLDRTSSRVQ